MQVSTVEFCDALPGTHITTFARKLIELKKKTPRIVIGRMNGVFIPVDVDTSVEDIEDCYYTNKGLGVV